MEMADRGKRREECDTHLVVGRKVWRNHAEYMQFGGVAGEVVVKNRCRIVDLATQHENEVCNGKMARVKEHEIHSRDSS